MTRKTAAWTPSLKPALEGQTFAGESLLTRYANLVRLPHTLFALPFALVGTIYASRSASVSAARIVLIVVAFTAARFAAMGFNRIVDLAIDARNPRTSNRELPAGRLKTSQAALAVVVASAGFIACAGMLNRVCLLLSPIALGWILAYSYTKRFTSCSHVWLGMSLAISPVGGYLAITGTWSTPGWALWSIAAAVATWVAGFDVFYALQDGEFDREHGLKSLVVLLGEPRAIIIAKLLHGGSIALLICFGAGAGLGWAYYAGVGIAALVLAWEHQLVKPGDLSRLDTAFFTMNGVMSAVVLMAMLVDRLV